MVTTSHRQTRPITAHPIIERLGRPGNPPSPPPKRIRLRRSHSSSDDTLPPEPIDPRRPRPDGSPQGPAPLGSSPGGSSPPPEPHGPLLLANRPRTRLPHPIKMLIAAMYRYAR